MPIVFDKSLYFGDTDVTDDDTNMYKLRMDDLITKILADKGTNGNLTYTDVSVQGEQKISIRLKFIKKPGEVIGSTYTNYNGKLSNPVVYSVDGLDGTTEVDNVDGNIILRKDNGFYKVGDNNKLEDTTYEYKEKVISFYNNTSNYSIVPSVRYGRLDDTTESKKKISLINYDKSNDVDVSFEKEVDRIMIKNNNKDKVYVILDKFLDKRVYEVSNTFYINNTGLNGKYTVYVKIKDKLYRTDYYIEV